MIPQRGQAGFTLLEIMLVVVLISITVTLVNLSIEPNIKSILREEANRFKSLLNQAQDESILTGRPIAIEVDTKDKSYRFLHIKDHAWEPIGNDNVFRKRNWSPRVSVKITMNRPAQQKDDAQSKSSYSPLRIIIEPVGTITPFKMVFSAQKESVVLGVNGQGQVALIPAKR